MSKPQPIRVHSPEPATPPEPRRKRSHSGLMREILDEIAAEPRSTDPDAFLAAVAEAVAELADAALACDPDNPRKVVDEVMRHVGHFSLASEYRSPVRSPQQIRKDLAWLAVQTILTDRGTYVRNLEGRDPSEAERLAVLECAWRASLAAMVAGSRAIEGERDARYAARDQAEAERRRQRRRDRRRREKAGPPAVPFGRPGACPPLPRPVFAGPGGLI